MESKKTTQSEVESSDDLLGTLIAGGIIFLAGYGLYKLCSGEAQQRRSLADRREADFIEDIAGKDIL